MTIYNFAMFYINQINENKFEKFYNGLCCQYVYRKYRAKKHFKSYYEFNKSDFVSAKISIINTFKNLY